MDNAEVAIFEQGSPIKKISRLHRLNFNSLTKPLAEIGIVRGTLPFIMEVLRHDGIIQQEITQALSIDPAATARALQQLERMEFVRREENKDNRRQKCVYATDRIRRIQGKILEILDDHKKQLFEGFSENEKIDFLNMLDRMINNIHSKRSINNDFSKQNHKDKMAK